MIHDLNYHRKIERERKRERKKERKREREKERERKKKEINSLMNLSCLKMWFKKEIFFIGYFSFHV